MPAAIELAWYGSSANSAQLVYRTRVPTILITTTGHAQVTWSDWSAWVDIPFYSNKPGVGPLPVAEPLPVIPP